MRGHFISMSLVFGGSITVAALPLPCIGKAFNLAALALNHLLPKQARCSGTSTRTGEGWSLHYLQAAGASQFHCMMRHILTLLAEKSPCR